MIRQKASIRSRGSSSSTGSNPRKKAKDCCRKFVAFMCTQVGVGGLIVGYAIVGAFSFMTIEKQMSDAVFTDKIHGLRKNCTLQIWNHTKTLNIFDIPEWRRRTNLTLIKYQTEISSVIKKGYDYRSSEEIWTFPAALMFCLSVFTMIGYGNMFPRTQWGKGLTVVYATFGIPLYILYFLNMGKILAKSFKFVYTTIHECSRERKTDEDIEDGLDIPPKKVIVPSTACLWVISFYILTGTIMFKYWENWSYLDSVYFCVTSLCKIGIGDFVPGTKLLDSQKGKNVKLAINFVYMLLGMGLVAMCYNLMREEVKVKMKEIKEDLKLCLEDVRDRFAGCCAKKDENNDFF